MTDNFGRRFPYLRLSVTDVCNFRCTYCLPHGYKKSGGETFLTVAEIRRAVEAFAGLGTHKIRLTGGEPTLREDFIEIARAVSGVAGIQKLAFTTNGYKLPERAKSYFEAGLRAINISIDSLDPQKFREVTGHDRLGEATAGMTAALEAGFDAVKINAVLLKGVNDDALGRFQDFIKDRPVSLRFIELMQTGDNLAFFKKHHVPAGVLQAQLAANGWTLLPRAADAGPALEYAHPGYQGTIGIIAPYAKDFCATCNRLRVSAKGDFHLCLFGTGGYPLRHLLQADSQKEELQEEIMRLLRFKKISHFLHDGDTGARPHLASIGG